MFFDTVGPVPSGPADRRVLELALDGGITPAELRLHGFGPRLRGDGLSVKKDPQFARGLRGGLAELPHAALDKRGARVLYGRCGQDRKQPQEKEGSQKAGHGAAIGRRKSANGKPKFGQNGFGGAVGPGF